MAKSKWIYVEHNLVIREMRKPHVIILYVVMSKIFVSTESVRKHGNSHKMVQPFWEIILYFVINVSIHLPYDFLILYMYLDNYIYLILIVENILKTCR